MKDKVFAVIDTPIDANSLSGQGLKHIMVVVRAAEANDKTLLDLLAAIKVDATTDILQIAVQQARRLDLNPVIDQYSIRKIITFGFTAEELGLNINHAYYHAYEIAGQTYILSESIALLKADKNKKIALWKNLQTVFLS